MNSRITRAGTAMRSYRLLAGFVVVWSVLGTAAGGDRSEASHGPRDPLVPPYTAADAMNALKMSVEMTTVKLSYDVTGDASNSQPDGRVTARDAQVIAQRIALGSLESPNRAGQAGGNGTQVTPAKDLTVPNVVGLAGDDAWATIIQAGLNARMETSTLRPPADSAAERVFNQAPPPGSKLAAGETVTVEIYPGVEAVRPAEPPPVVGATEPPPANRPADPPTATATEPPPANRPAEPPVVAATEPPPGSRPPETPAVAATEPPAGSRPPETPAVAATEPPVAHRPVEPPSIGTTEPPNGDRPAETPAVIGATEPPIGRRPAETPAVAATGPPSGSYPAETPAVAATEPPVAHRPAEPRSTETTEPPPGSRPAEPPRKPTVTDLAGMTKDEAELAILNLGLNPHIGVGKRRAPAETEVGQVYMQVPPAGTELSPGDDVKAVIYPRRPSVAAPNLTGLSRAEAAAAVTNLGLVPQIGEGTRPAPSADAAGRVYKQLPPAGTELAEGETMMIAVYRPVERKGAGKASS